MAEPVQLVAEVAGDGFLKVGFKQGGKWMKTDQNGSELASVTLQYPRQWEMMRNEGDLSETEKKVTALNSYLKYPNELLKGWCS